MAHYRTNFTLTDEVKDLEKAQAYLWEHDMTQYLAHTDIISAKDHVLNIQWTLRSTSAGSIDLITDRQLTEDELAEISRWVLWQNTDGLGRGFERQDFACDDSLAMASFDWVTNSYTFKEVR